MRELCTVITFNVMTMIYVFDAFEMRNRIQAVTMAAATTAITWTSCQRLIQHEHFRAYERLTASVNHPDCTKADLRLYFTMVFRYVVSPAAKHAMESIQNMIPKGKARCFSRGVGSFFK